LSPVVQTDRDEPFEIDAGYPRRARGRRRADPRTRQNRRRSMPATIRRKWGRRYADEECARQEGGAVTFAPDTVRKVDLTGDGRDDYIVDFRDTRVRHVFDGYVRTYEILPGRRRPHHTLRAAWRILRRPRQPVLHQRAPHHGKAVWV